MSPQLLWVYVTCPGCRERIKEPFSRMSGPVVHTHRYGGHDQVCRVLVVPAQVGAAHRVSIVPRDVRLEDALQQALERRATGGEHA